MYRTKQPPKIGNVQKICNFFESYAFLISLGLLIFALYALHLPILTMAICAACFTFICFCCKDTRPALAVLLLFLFSLRWKDDKAAYVSVAAIVVYVVCGIPLLVSMLYRLIKRRVEWKQKTGLLSIALLCATILIGGVFSKYYTVRHFAYAAGNSAMLFVPYLFFAYTMEKREDNLLYFARICAVVVCLISLQVLEIYCRLYQWGTPLDATWKWQITLGWAISNIVAEMIIFLLPAVFYLVYKEEKGYLYWLVVGVGLIAVYFTFGRNALLWGVIATFVGAIVNCCIGPNRRANRIMVFGVIALALVVVFALFSFGYLDSLLAFFTEVKLDDRGRFEIWESHVELFLEYPVQGVGFKTYHDLYQGLISYAHNTLVQMLAATGALGLILYLVHRIQTVYILMKQPTADRLFIGSCIVVSVLMCMLSSAFFYMYFMLYYTVIVMLLEKSCDD